MSNGVNLLSRSDYQSKVKEGLFKGNESNPAWKVFDSTSDVEEAGRIDLGLKIANEFIKLLQKRMDSVTKDSKMFQEHKKADEMQIREIQTYLIPLIREGKFVLTSNCGLSLEFADRRITLRAPNQSWDEDYKQAVISASKDNSFAQKVFKAVGYIK